MNYLELLDKALHELEDRYLGSSRTVQMLIDAPICYSFCDANKDDIAEQTIVLMALQIIAKEYDITMSYQLDEWVERFKEASLKYILNK